MTLFFVIFGFLYSEIVGYFLHRLLHSEKIQWLSRNHMLHHLRDYGPKMPMRSDVYKASTGDRFNFGGVGLEWVGPIALVLIASILILSVLKVSAAHQATLFITGIIWSVFGFNYIHDGLHVKNFWMLDPNKWISRWFKNARRLHDIHHVTLNDHGKMNKNFGITSFFLDRIFGTYCSRAPQFNNSGMEKAKQTYSYIYGENK